MAYYIANILGGQNIFGPMSITFCVENFCDYVPKNVIVDLFEN